MVQYNKTLTGSPKYSVRVDGDLKGYTDEIGLLQYDVTAKKLDRAIRIEPTLKGYKELCPTLFLNQDPTSSLTT